MLEDSCSNCAKQFMVEREELRVYVGLVCYLVSCGFSLVFVLEEDRGERLMIIELITDN